MNGSGELILVNSDSQLDDDVADDISSSQFEPERRFLNLHHAAAVGSIRGCAYALDAEGVDVNEINDFDESALYCARCVQALHSSEFCNSMALPLQPLWTYACGKVLIGQRSSC